MLERKITMSKTLKPRKNPLAFLKEVPEPTLPELSFNTAPEEAPTTVYDFSINNQTLTEVD